MTCPLYPVTFIQHYGYWNKQWEMTETLLLKGAFDTKCERCILDYLNEYYQASGLPATETKSHFRAFKWTFSRSLQKLSILLLNIPV